MRVIRKYWAIFTTQLINNLAYGGDLLARSLTIIMFMWIFTQLWKVTYLSLGEQTIAGLTLRDTLWYLMIAEAIVLSKARLSSVIAESVKDGSIAYQLNKPYNFILYQFSVGFGDSLLRLIVNLLAGGTIIWLLVGPPPSSQGIPLTLIAIFLGWLIDFCITSLIGLAAFLTEEIAAFEWIYHKLVLLLGGVLIPLDFFPGWLRSITQSLPFAFSTYAPARFFIDPHMNRFVLLLAGQLVWLLVLGSLLAIFYRRGSVWLSINGG